MAIQGEGSNNGGDALNMKGLDVDDKDGLNVVPIC